MSRVRHVVAWSWLVGLVLSSPAWARPQATPTPTPTPSPSVVAPAAPETVAPVVPIAPAPTVAPVQPVTAPTVAPVQPIVVPPASPAPTATPAPALAPPAPGATSPQQPVIHAIWDYQKELGLSNEQISRIKQTIRDLQDKAEHARSRYVAASRQLETLEAKDTTDLNLIKSKMQEIASIQIDMQIENIKAKRYLHHIITPAQMAKWHTIQESDQPQQR